MLYLIGLGLWDEKDVSYMAIEILKKCDFICSELYTGHWKGSFKNLEKICNKEIRILEREDVETNFLVEKAKDHNVALLVPGDPLTATTHFELLLAAREKNIMTKVIHSSSIYTAVAESGLQLYKFGRTTTIAMPEMKFIPESPYKVIAENYKQGLHTLVLIDTKDKMTITEALKTLMMIEKNRKGDIFKKKILVMGKLGSPEKVIKYGLPENVMLDTYPGIIVIPGKLHFKEEEALKIWE